MYLVAGGLRAVYWTDVVQGIWMYAAIWIGALASLPIGAPPLSSVAVGIADDPR